MCGSRALRLLAVVTAFAAFVLWTGSVAFAGPPEPIMSFNDLRSVLSTAASPGLDGCMRTEVKAGDIETIPLTITWVPDTGNADNDLIGFEATGTLMQQYGGVVAGMSGSPVYVYDPNDSGAPKLVGAVSYGDYFTLGGAGLATPIEAMMDVESEHGTQVVPLSKPVITSGGVVNQIIIAPDPQDYAGAAAAGAFVARPLASAFIGGLDPKSKGYKALAADFQKRGILNVSLSHGLGSGSGDGSPYDVPLVSGGSVAAMLASGDMWYGDVGTVTYVDGSNVLAFGHPAFWTGPAALDMTNAYIDGIWPSSYEPYKVAEPGALKGAITQDRNAGILGKIGTFTTETTITAHAKDLDTGASTDSTVCIPTQLFVNGFADGTLASDAVYMAGYKLFDDAGHAGSAHTTTTVEVMDHQGTKYDISIPNFVDSSSDIAYDASYDAENAVESLQAVLEWGVDEPRIVSIKLDGEYTAQRASETIVGVDAPNGIHVGDNPVVVQELVYGDPDTRTVDTTVTVPAGTALGGYLVASSPSAALDDDEDVSSILVGDEGISLDVFGSDARESIAQIADDLNHSQPNNTMIVTFQPGQSDLSSSDDGDDSGDDSGSLAGQVAQLKNTLSTDPITNDLTTLRPTDSRARADLTDMLVEADPSAIPYGEFSDVVGEIDGPDVKSVVSLYASQPGTTTETLVETQTVKPVQGLLPFDFQLDEMFTNTTFRVHVDAGSDLDSGNAWTTGNKTVTVSVRAITSLSMSASSLKAGKKVKLTASVYPASAAGGGVVFERQVHRGWKRIASATLSASGSVAKATYKWKPAKGTNKVRARYLGGVFNATSNSATKTVKVK